MHEDIKRLQDMLNRIEDEALRAETLSILQTIEKRSNDAHDLANYIANMAHEFRTPLNTIIGYSEILKTEMEGSLNPEQHEDIAYINQAGLSLLHIISDLADLARIEVGQFPLNLSQFEIPILLERQTPILETLAKANHCTLTITLDVLPTQTQIETDKESLIHILKNLVQHATRDSQQSQISLGISDAIWLKQGFRFLIQERGRGLEGTEWREAAQIFETVGATGLGSERRLAQFLQGQLVIEAEKDGDFTDYILELPYKLE